METLPINEIKVENRRREEFGDINGLAESIRKYGLFHPVIVDDHNNLIAGERRLRACKSLEWSEIPVKSYSDLTDDERNEIEIEENVQRKDLTPHELSKEIVRRVEKIVPIISSTMKEKDSRGRKSQHKVSKKDIAQALGKGEATIIRAEQHVASVQKYPELAIVAPTQKDAITVAKNLDALSDDDRSKARSQLMKHDQSVLAVLAEKPPMPKAKPKTDKRPSDKWREHIQNMRQFFSGIEQTGGVLSLISRWTEREGFNFLDDLRGFRTDLDGFINDMETQYDELKQQAG